MKYNIRYFIDKFKEIPAEQWTSSPSSREPAKKDFMGHLNSYPNSISEEGQAFIDLTVGFIVDEFGRMMLLYMIDSGEHEFHKIGSSPKDRWVRWLEALERKGQQKEEKTGEKIAA